MACRAWLEARGTLPWARREEPTAVAPRTTGQGRTQHTPTSEMKTFSTAAGLDSDKRGPRSGSLHGFLESGRVGPHVFPYSRGNCHQSLPAASLMAPTLGSWQGPCMGTCHTSGCRREQLAWLPQETQAQTYSATIAPAAALISPSWAKWSLPQHLRRENTQVSPGCPALPHGA